jgi:hypothetical protein
MASSTTSHLFYAPGAASLTSSGVASHPTAPAFRQSPTDLLILATRRIASFFGPSGLALETEASAKTVRCFTALLGMVALASRFAIHAPKSISGRVAREEDHLFRRLFPADPAPVPERTSAMPAGGDRGFVRLPLLRAVAGPPKRLARESLVLRPEGRVNLTAATAGGATHRPAVRRPDPSALLAGTPTRISRSNRVRESRDQRVFNHFPELFAVCHACTSAGA